MNKPTSLLKFKKFADTLDYSTRTLFTLEKNDPEFPQIIRINGWKFLTAESGEQYRQTVIRRALEAAGGRRVMARDDKH